MALTREQKEEIVQDLAEMFGADRPVTFIQFNGLSVALLNEIRAKLRESNIRFQVVKKTLLDIALNEAKPKGERPEFPGQVALVYPQVDTPDHTLPAREIYAFQEDHEENITILGGIFEGAYKDKESMTAVARIPSPEVLRGMFANVVSSPIQRFALVLDQVAQQKE